MCQPSVPLTGSVLDCKSFIDTYCSITHTLKLKFFSLAESLVLFTQFLLPGHALLEGHQLQRSDKKRT